MTQINMQNPIKAIAPIDVKIVVKIAIEHPTELKELVIISTILLYHNYV